VTKKNRKARRLNELYPDVKCKILYQRDYQSLLLKYGLEDAPRGTDEEVAEAGGRGEESPQLGSILAG
jgi:hypothetical protein